MASSALSRGTRVLFVGVDDLWRIRYDVGDRYYGRFWKGAVQWLAGRP